MGSVVRYRNEVHCRSTKEARMHTIRQAGQTSGFSGEGPRHRAIGFAKARVNTGLIVCAVAGTLTATGSLDARAALGGRADAAAAHATATQARAASAVSFTSRSVATAQGGALTEFSDASGLVFAVAWKAPVMPALDVLLGTWAPAFTLAQQRQMQSGRETPGAPLLSLRSMSAQEGDLVAFSAGRPQAYWGYAYLRSAVPAGFDVAQLAH
jgi:hypothetical protein